MTGGYQTNQPMMKSFTVPMPTWGGSQTQKVTACYPWPATKTSSTNPDAKAPPAVFRRYTDQGQELMNFKSPGAWNIRLKEGGEASMKPADPLVKKPSPDPRSSSCVAGTRARVMFCRRSNMDSEFKEPVPTTYGHNNVSEIREPVPTTYGGRANSPSTGWTSPIVPNEVTETVPKLCTCISDNVLKEPVPTTYGSKKTNEFTEAVPRPHTGSNANDLKEPVPTTYGSNKANDYLLPSKAKHDHGEAASVTNKTLVVESSPVRNLAKCRALSQGSLLSGSGAGSLATRIGVGLGGGRPSRTVASGLGGSNLMGSASAALLTNQVMFKEPVPTTYGYHTAMEFKRPVPTTYGHNMSVESELKALVPTTHGYNMAKEFKKPVPMTYGPSPWAIRNPSAAQASMVGQLSAVKLVVFDFDCTLSVFHVFASLGGGPATWKLPVPAPHARTERGQLHRLAELDAHPDWGPGVFALRAFGGKERVAQLRKALEALALKGVECIVCSRGLVGTIRKCLDQLNLLTLFSHTLGSLGNRFGTSSYDEAVARTAGPERYLGSMDMDVGLEGAASKAETIMARVTARGLKVSEVIYIDDDITELKSSNVQTIHVAGGSGIGDAELRLLRVMVDAGDPSENDTISVGTPSTAASISPGWCSEDCVV